MPPGKEVIRDLRNYELEYDRLTSLTSYWSSEALNGITTTYVYYDSLTVQRQYERLIYDNPAFMSALGGGLGLWLGFSGFGCLRTLSDAVRRRLREYN